MSSQYEREGGGGGTVQQHVDGALDKKVRVLLERLPRPRVRRGAGGGGGVGGFVKRLTWRKACGVRDAACPISTGRRTRRVRSVRRGGGGDLAEGVYVAAPEGVDECGELGEPTARGCTL